MAGRINSCGTIRAKVSPTPALCRGISVRPQTLSVFGNAVDKVIDCCRATLVSVLRPTPGRPSR